MRLCTGSRDRYAHSACAACLLAQTSKAVTYLNHLLCQKASLRRISRSVGKLSQRCWYHVIETCVTYCRGLKLDYILNTHHHWDHTGGNEELKSKFKCTIVGPKADKGRIPGIDIALGDGESWQFGDLKMEVFDTPGHTRGHITLWFPQVEALFPG